MKAIIETENYEEAMRLLESLRNKEVDEGLDEVTRPAVSQYARFFDETCRGWSSFGSEFNLIFLRVQQDYATEKLKAQGYLFLNEVYDMLGMPRTKAGCVVGWVYDLDSPIGDNCVDFGLYDECNKNFINGYEKTALLDFNVDGIITERVFAKENES